MTLKEIRQMPTCTDEIKGIENIRTNMIHESILRSFHIVEKIEDLLRKNTPSDVLLEIIEDLKG